MTNAILKIACLIMGSALLTATTQLAAKESEQEMVKVWKVDFSGRPPFKRELVELPVADVAALETSNEVLETELVWQIDFSGKPPFKRKLVEIPVIDAASMEVESESDRSHRNRPLGAFKRHR